MTKILGYERVVSVLVGTLLAVELLAQGPSGRAQQPDARDPSRLRQFKIQQVRERLQAGCPKAEALRVQAARSAQRPGTRVLRRELLGRYIEDVDFVPNGPSPSTSSCWSATKSTACR